MDIFQMMSGNEETVHCGICQTPLRHPCSYNCEKCWAHRCDAYQCNNWTKNIAFCDENHTENCQHDTKKYDNNCSPRLEYSDCISC